MTALDSALNPDHFERPDALYSLKPVIAEGALLGNTARQLSHCADFPVEKYTPGSPLGEAPLTDANIAQSIRNAYAACKAAGGGNVLIPAGQWHMGASGALVFDGSGLSPSKPIHIKGAGTGLTILEFPSPWTTVAVHMKGSGGGLDEGAYTYGGLSGLSIFADALDPANTGVGIRIDACIYTEFANLDVRNFRGGKGVECNDFTIGGGSNSQYVQLYNVAASGNGRNYDLSELTNSQAIGLYSGFAYDHDFVFQKNVMLAIIGAFMQGDAAEKILFDGDGGSRILLADCYHEGANATATVIKANVPAVSANALEVVRFDLHAAVGTFADYDAFMSLKIDTVYRVTNAAKILKGRNGSNALLINCSSPEALPSYFDLDAASLAELCCISNGRAYQSILKLTTGLRPAVFADGAEPASPVQGQEHFNSTTERKRVWGEDRAAWSDVAFVDDPVSITDTLEPYAEAVFDFNVASSMLVVGGGPDEASQATDVLNGAIATPSGSGARPEFIASDPFFGGNASIVCDNGSAHYLAGTFDTDIPIGAYPGIFIVFRTIGGQTPDPRVLAQLGGAGSALALLGDDDSFPNHVYGLYDTVIAGSPIVDYSAVTLDHNVHIAYAYAGDADSGKLHVQVDRGPDQFDNNQQFGLSTAAHNFYIGTGSGLAGSNMAIAYVAFLKAKLPSSVIRRAVALARARFSL